MTGPRRMIAAVSAASLTLLGGVGVLLTAPAASAAPAVSSLSCGPYGAANCGVFFNNPFYNAGQIAQFALAQHAFLKFEPVIGVLTGPLPLNHSRGLVQAASIHKTYSFKAGKKGGLKGKIKLPKHLRKGRYTLTVTGKRSHRRHVGHFTVR